MTPISLCSAPSRRALGLLALLLAALGLLPPGALAFDLPHTNSIANCGDCHLLHRAPGVTLTSKAGNANLCLSCHTAGKVAAGQDFADSDQALPGLGLPAGIPAGGTSHRWDSSVAGHAVFLGGTSTGTVEPGGAFTGAYAKTYTITITNAGNSGAARFNWVATSPGGGAGTNVLTGTNVALNEGVWVTFQDGTNTSFQANDRWNIYVRSDLRAPTNTVLLSVLTTNGFMMCSSCHNQHSQANAPFDPGAPDYTTNNLGAGRHYQRIANDTDQMCVDCHAARNVTNSLAGSHPVGISPLTNSYYKGPATLPLDKTASQVRCSTCHQVHSSPEGDGTLVRTTNHLALCTDCHLLANVTTPAAHLNRTNSALWPGGQYGTTFPTVTDTTKRGSCGNCHQAHGWPTTTNTAVHYAKLLVDTEENLCFTCHDADGPAVKNVKDDFAAKVRRHPIGDADSLRRPGRSVECNDCHNPHKALSGAHTYTNNATASRNLVSNPLKGVSGVAVNYTGLGNFVAPGINLYTAIPTSAGATNEYQICFKCHTAYSFGSTPSAGLTPVYSTGTATFTTNNTAVTGSSTGWGSGMVGLWIYPANNPAAACRITAVASATSLTISPAYGGATATAQGYAMSAETDVAQEFNPANGSFHPIVTGLTNGTGNGTGALRPLQTTQLKAPWLASRGTQTMMCSDCHNTDAASSAAQGPHGSAAVYMLRGPNTLWPPTVRFNSGTSLQTAYGTSFCANCHTYTSNNSAHSEHSTRSLYCYSCHILVPHGGKLGRLIGDGRSASAMPSRYAYNNAKTNMFVNGFTKTTYNNYQDSSCSTSCGHHSTSGGTTW